MRVPIDEKPILGISINTMACWNLVITLCNSPDSTFLIDIIIEALTPQISEHTRNKFKRNELEKTNLSILEHKK